MKNIKLTITLELEWQKSPSGTERLYAKNSQVLTHIAEARSSHWFVYGDWVDSIKRTKGECKSVLAGKRKILKYLRDNGFVAR